MLLRILAICAVTACASNASDEGPGGSDAPADLDVIASQPAHGTVAGKTFTLGTRHMHISDGELWVNLLTDPVADCSKDQTDGSYPLVIFFTRPTAGRYALSFETQTVTFVDRSSSNLVVTSGMIQIDAITDAQVTGGLHVFSADFGEINGRFDGKLCYSR
jgi:hypothetical protein